MKEFIKKNSDTLIIIFFVVAVIGISIFGNSSKNKTEQEYGEEFLKLSKEYSTETTIFGEVRDVELDLITDEYEIELKVLDDAKDSNGRKSYEYNYEYFIVNKDILNKQFTLEKGIRVVITPDSSIDLKGNSNSLGTVKVLTEVKAIEKVKQSK